MPKTAWRAYRSTIDEETLWRPFTCLDQAPVFEHTCCQPLADQPDDALVANPMLDEANQPIPAELKSQSSTQLIRFFPIPNASASSAWCWLRFGRNP